MKKVKQEDYSDSYSHPYFKAIEKGGTLEEVTSEMLMTVNNAPAVYPLHFAIDKEREDLVELFLSKLSKEQVELMRDDEGTSVQEYS